MKKNITLHDGRPEVTRFLVRRGWNLRPIDHGGFAATRTNGTRLVEYLEVFPLMHDEQPSMEVARIVAHRSALGYRVAVTGSLRWFEAWYIANAFEMSAADETEVLCSK